MSKEFRHQLSIKFLNLRWCAFHKFNIERNVKPLGEISHDDHHCSQKGGIGMNSLYHNQNSHEPIFFILKKFS